MREIKFRAFGGRGMVEWKDLKYLHISTVFQQYEGYHVMQYTGLKDKNGKDIYEGDIIKNIQADVNEVFYWGNGFHYRNYHAQAISLDDTISVDDWQTTQHEVIGNIHENPELL